MKIKRLFARAINDTRGDKTIEVYLKTDFGEFIASAANGKSRGIYEAKPWKKNILSDINFINKYFIEEINFKDFNDLILLENIFKKNVGANSMTAIEFVFLKALAYREDKQVWELINPRSKEIPFSIGNTISGGVHSSEKPKPDFQEFHFIPITNFKKSFEINKRARENCAEILKNIDKNFKFKTSDENAWQTSLSNEKVVELMKDVKENMIDEFGVKIHLGVDIAASQFFNGKNYKYKNEKKILTKEQQINYMQKLSDVFYYIEDPLEENDFSGFSETIKKSKSLICGDDLTATNLERLQVAVKKKSINSMIIKPNQIGSLIEVKKIVDFCRKNKIKIVFSHRSGETSEDILADLAFAFQANFIKTGICGKGRDEKLQRMIKIEEQV